MGSEIDEIVDFQGFGRNGRWFSGLFWVCFGGGGRHYESEVSILDFWSVFGSPDSQFLNVRVMWRGGGFKIIFWPLFTLLVMPKSARNGGERYTVVALERVEAHT